MQAMAYTQALFIMIALGAIEQFCKEEEIPLYRARQIFEAIYEKGLQSYDEITTLPKNLRKKLTEKFPICSVIPIATQISTDKSTEKVLFKLHDGGNVESVLMHFKDGRKTVCISSEVGCPLKCKFCASGTLMFRRDLTAEEIADQILYFARRLNRSGERTARARTGGSGGFPRSEPYEKNQRLNHVVYMGIGEPFRNYDNVMQSIKILMDEKFLGLGARKITISTAGIADKIRAFADEPFQVNLALSLHAPTQELREQIMPIAKRYHLDELLDAIREYLQKTNRRISFEYVMLNNINDSEKCARELVQLINTRLKKEKHLIHVNLIPYNATDIPGITGSPKQQIKKFRDILIDAHIPATIRVSLGQDIAAACGQLANTPKRSGIHEA